MNKSTSVGASFALATGLLGAVGLTGTNAGAAPAVGHNYAADGPTAQDDTDAKPDLVFDETNDSQTVDATVDNIFEVHLVSNGSTGFSWSVTTQDTALIESDGAPKYVRPAGAPLGAPGHQIFRFKIKGAGDTKLELHYTQPWRKDTPPTKTFTLNLAIKDAAD